MQESSNTIDIALQNWQLREERYHSHIRPWMDAFRHRRERRQTHPVHDFLFEYYQFNRKLVYNWHPAIGDKLSGPEARRFLEHSQFSESNSTVFLNPLKMNESESHRMDWICSLITAAMKNPERTNCYGLHEWAMVYKSDCIRHESTPLRLKPDQIEATIESANVYCTHYDAFRFFTQKAKPLNSLQPTADKRKANDQFGCVHFNMDLFKWCYKLHPWISSELTLDCFLLAVEARELDMRASPYDLQAIGYAPILIETTEGKQQYQSQQKAIAAKGRKLATRFLKECSELTG